MDKGRLQAKKMGAGRYRVAGNEYFSIKKTFPETQGRFFFKKSSISYSLFACINGKCIRIAQRCTVK